MLQEESEPEEQAHYRPVVPTVLKIPQTGESQPIYMLVDSGADTTLLDADFAKLLGLRLQDGEAEPTEGVAGQATAYYFRLCLEIGGISFPARVGFLRGLPMDGLLDRQDVFDRFKVQLRGSEQKTLLCAEITRRFGSSEESGYCAWSHEPADDSQCATRQCFASGLE